MSLKLRFALVLGLLLVGLAASLAVLHRIERGITAESVANERQSREQLLNHWLDLTGRALPQITSDYADQLSAAPANRPPAELLREKILEDLPRTGVQGVWLLDAKGTPIAQIAREGAPGPLPITASDFATLVAQTPSPRFFVEAANALLEVCVRRLHPPAEREGPSGAPWLLVTRVWDQNQIDTLAGLTGSAVALVPASTTLPASGPGRIVLLRPLADWQGYPLRLLRLDYQAPELERLGTTNGVQVGVFVIFGLLVLVAMWLALQAWVLRPLGLISSSLKSEDGAAIQPLRSEPGELGAVAQLVATSFDQRVALEREVDERARAQAALQKSEVALRRTMDERTRLGRDLHDGIIQSLYAAGMGLAGIRAQLHLDQSEAAARLEQTRATLNETIHDLRNFINGLEPESLKLQNFTQAITALLEVVNGLRPVQTAVSIDESLALQLTLSQRVHALQIAREAISNALRHGEASRVTIALRPAGEYVEFEVTDNGRGFDAAAATTHGLGLENFTERARELGAELTVDSTPGHGTRVSLVFALFKTL
jgi:signal transduction histidine kinase